MNSTEKKFLEVRVYEENGVPFLHKPCLLLYMLGRCYLEQERLVSFNSVDLALKNLFQRYYPAGLVELNTHYPFGKLENDDLWEIERSSGLKRTAAGHLSKKQLLEEDVRAGFTLDVYNSLILDKSLLLEIASRLLNRFFPLEKHTEIRSVVDLPVTSMKYSSLNNIKPTQQQEYRMVNQNEQGFTFKNSYIDYLNSLHNLGAGGANALAESQATNSYFSHLYQAFPVVDDIVKALKDSTPKVIVLTGHAGDGKSTVALDVFKQLKGLPANQELAESLNTREEIVLDTGKIFIVKDMSELAASQRLDWLKHGFSQAGNWLIVSNTGPLLNSLSDYVQDQKTASVESKVLDILDHAYAKGNLEPHTMRDLPKELVILNMTRLDNVTLGASLLSRMVNHPAWSQCDSCPSKSACPISLNRIAVQDASEVIEQRVRWVYRRLTAYERRLTLRQMIAHLALSLTGGMGCEQAHDYAKQENSSLDGLERIIFSESFFGYQRNEPWIQAESLRAIELVRRIVFGTPTGPNFERELSRHGEVGGLILPLSLTKVRLHWTERAKDFSGVRWRYAIRRMAYLFGIPSPSQRLSGDLFFDTFLSSPRLRNFDQWKLDRDFNMSAGDRGKLTRDCLQVLLEVFSGFSVGQFSSGHDRLYLTLRRSNCDVVQISYLVIAEFEFSRFQIVFDRARCELLLRYQPSQIDLILSLPLLDFIHARSIGNLGDGLAPIHLAQLECFRAELLKDENKPDGYEGQIGLLRAGIDGTVKLYRYVLDEDRQRLERQ